MLLCTWSFLRLERVELVLASPLWKTDEHDDLEHDHARQDREPGLSAAVPSAAAAPLFFLRE